MSPIVTHEPFTTAARSIVPVRWFEKDAEALAAAKDAHHQLCLANNYNHIDQVETENGAPLFEVAGVVTYDPDTDRFLGEPAPLSQEEQFEQEYERVYHGKFNFRNDLAL